MIQKVAVVFVLLLLLLLMPASAQSALDIANQHKKILDTYSKVIDTVSYNGSTYHIIKYYNVFPYADGIEIITAEGSQVTDPAIAKSVFTQSAWKTAAIQFKQYDIAALQGINKTTQAVYDAISPIDAAASSMIAKMTELKSLYLFGEGAWDVMKSAYPDITTLESELNVLNESLNVWGAASTSVTTNLTEIIRGFEDSWAGTEQEPELRQNIQETLPALEALKTETEYIGSYLSNVSSTLTDAECALNSTTNTTSETTTAGSIVHEEIATFADSVGDLNAQVNAIIVNLSPISGSISEQSSGLSTVVNVTSDETDIIYDSLYVSWNSRRKAPIMVYSTLGGIVAVVFAIIFGALIYVMGSESLKRPTKREGVTGEAERGMGLNARGSTNRAITGVIITAVGLILLLYSFITAYNFCIGEFTLDESFVMKVIFLSCMIGIGVYLTEKGATLSEHSMNTGIILIPIGLTLLCFSFMVANTFVNREFIFFTELFIAKIAFLICMIEIGGYLTSKGVALMDRPMVTGIILTPIGAVMLLYSFITASVFVSSEFMDQNTLIIVLIYFMCMVGIGGYLTGRGVSQLLKR